MISKSAFFDFFNRRENGTLDSFLASAVEDEDYIDWNGCLLPQNYGDAALEYHAIRDSCAMFDVSPMRKVRIRGAAAGRFLDHLLTRPVSTADSLLGIYVAYCNVDGSLKDDSILYKFAYDDYLLMPSDMDHSPYFEQLRQQLNIAADELSITDITSDLCGLAVQGPLSATVLQHMGFADIEQLQPFEVRSYPFANATMVVARMGFTADLGYECWLEHSLQSDFEAAIEDARGSMGIAIPGYGLSALEVCRLEAGFVVAGWDFSTEADFVAGFDRTPYEAGLGWLVKLDGGDFVGRDALLKYKAEGHRYTLRTFSIDDTRGLEDGAELHANVDGEDLLVGTVNCSAWSWGLEKTIGNASMLSAHANLSEVWLERDGDRLKVSLSKGAHLNLARRNECPALIES